MTRLLTLVLIALTLVACNRPNSANESGASPASSATSATTTSAAGSATQPATTSATPAAASSASASQPQPPNQTGQTPQQSGTTPQATEHHVSEQCGAPATLISQVQGTTNRSPMVGQAVTIEGVVVGDFQNGDGDRYRTNLGGYFVQEEDADQDGDPATSEGIYILDSRTDVNLGDLVRVTGNVIETGHITHLTRPSEVIICATDHTLPTPASIEFPLASIEGLEAYEGMLVTFPQELVISEYFNYDRFGEVVLAWPGENRTRVYQPTHDYTADDPRAHQAMDNMRFIRITLDDGIGDQNPELSRHPAGGLFSISNSFRGGDRLKNLTGILDYRFDTYRIQPVLGAEHINANPRPEVPDDVGGTVRAAAFNVLNYFTRTMREGLVCGPLGTSECRGADTAAELQRQRAKIVAALVQLDAHVVGLMEIENDADHASLADLVAGLNEAAGAGTYDYVNTVQPVGNDDIKVALIYQPAVLTPVGAPAVLNDDAFVNPLASREDRNRAALAQTFADQNGGQFTIVVNHLKSKGSACGERPEGGLQGNCNQTRVAAVKELLAWLQTDPTAASDPDYLIVGDLNSYAQEDPTLALLAGPDGIAGTADDYVDLLAEHVGPDAYTYVFDGMLGYLDYAVASPTLATQVTGTTAWNINADEPDIIDYDMSFKKAPQQAFYSPDPYRSSDHDPVLVGLQLERTSR